MKYPQRGRLLMDSNTSTLYWTDPGLKVMKFFQYGPNSDPLFNYMGNASGISFRAPPINNQPYVPHYPCGMAIDRGLGPPAFDDYLDCYGNGVCEGQAGNCRFREAVLLI